jgi:ketosteroid isomerase-like protein
MTMPQENNLEIMRQAAERLNAGDLDGFLELCAVDVEARDRPGAPDSEVHRGHAGVRAWWLKLTEGLTDLSFKIDELPEAGDSVVMASRAVGRRRESGGDDLAFFIVATLRPQRRRSDPDLPRHRELQKAIGTLVAHGDRTPALEAAGVQEGATAPEKIDLAESMYAAFSTLAGGGDVASYVREYFHPECEYQPAGANVIRGHEELIRWHENRLEAWEEFRAEVHEITENGPVLVVTVAVKGRGAGTGVEIAPLSFHLIEIRGTKVLRMSEHLDRHQLVEAAALRG